MAAALCAVAAVLLSFGIPWVAIPAAICAFAAAITRRSREHATVGFARAVHPAAAQAIFGVGFLRGVYWLLFEQSLVPPERLDGFRGLALFAFIVGSAYLCVHLRASLEKARFWVLIVLFAVLALALEPRFVPLLAALLAGIAVGRSGRARAVIARSGAAFTAELAALFLLYQPRTWHELTLSSATALLLPAAVLTSLLASLVSATWTARATAGIAAICVAAAWRSGHLVDGLWLASALLCAAAAVFSHAETSSRAVPPAR